MGTKTTAGRPTEPGLYWLQEPGRSACLVEVVRGPRGLVIASTVRRGFNRWVVDVEPDDERMLVSDVHESYSWTHCPELKP